ncbi:core protein [Tent-making bat hepatitis B virus]|uniref:Core protein n=1 Tax=Tent-making bat hepatitis B virus TaxID=1508712 RepID=U3M6H7_9HEPA|nr:core protein [Tent-making bat hepatitis B virus]YP_010775523.1 core protein [Tent-making bat hepatitis B virus]AGT17578.1 core protein [Tent-making bat hepatitis B virus]AGT17579.1 core protein [Tent-making bat hepatitis B virus]AGT17580.1 core protein [Tent-making bat hepatitis B virus]AGT17581.1 core protein [Tent-making bat hepatitis B virus]AZQ19428.1 core protein [Tent-making bat hepatitis B virus]
MENLERLDIYKEFGVSDVLVSFLPDDFFPTLQQLLESVNALYEDELTGPNHCSPHHTALRHLIMCGVELRDFIDWMHEQGLSPDADALLAGYLRSKYLKHITKAIWYHLSCLTFGKQTVHEYLVSFGTWIRTPAAYRPVNAPILTTLPETSVIRRRPASRRSTPSPRRRRSQSPRRRRSPSPRPASNC